jgi:hypothetical protein
MFMIRSLLLFALAALFTSTTSAQEKKRIGKEPQPIVIQLNLNELPPDVARRLLEIAGSETQPKKGPKKDEAAKPEKKEPKQPKADSAAALKKAPKGSGRTITLVDAIGIAERLGRGDVVKAERKGDQREIHYKIELRDRNGEKQKIRLGSDGKLSKDDKKDGKKKDGKKGEGKKKDEKTSTGPQNPEALTVLPRMRD